MLNFAHRTLLSCGSHRASSSVHVGSWWLVPNFLSEAADSLLKIVRRGGFDFEDGTWRGVLDEDGHTVEWDNDTEEGKMEEAWPATLCTNTLPCPVYGHLDWLGVWVYVGFTVALWVQFFREQIQALNLDAFSRVTVCNVQGQETKKVLGCS